MNFNPNDVAIVLALLGFLSLVVRTILDYLNGRNVNRAYNDLVTGIVTNRELTGTLTARYATLTPDQKKWFDAAFNLVDELSRLTPDTADDVIRDWSAQIRHNTITPATAQSTK